MARELRIGICDHNRVYTSAMAAYINDDTSLSMRAVAFTDTDEVMAYLEERSLDIIIADNHLPCEKTDKGCYVYRDVPCLLLEEAPKEDGCYVTARYQNVRNICSKAASLLAGRVVKEKVSISLSEVTGEVTGVYSPFGRCGRTYAAKNLVRNAGASYLYVAMEDLSPYPTSCDLLYMVKTDNGRFEETALECVKQIEGINTLILSDFYMDAKLINADDMNRIISGLLSSGIYRGLVFDIGTASLGDPEILKTFGRLILPVPPGELCKRKFDTFKRIMTSLGYGDILARAEIIEGYAPENSGWEDVGGWE